MLVDHIDAGKSSDIRRILEEDSRRSPGENQALIGTKFGLVSVEA